MGQLEGEVAVVTGASRGIGLAIARRCAQAQAKVVLVGRHPAALRRAAREIGGAALAVAADVTQPADVKRLFGRVERRFGRLDLLVNNAGAFIYKAFRKTTYADWRRNIETNLTSIFLTTQAALPLLERSPAAHLVNILSTSSRSAFPNCSAYTAAKFGALGLTRVLRQELRARGIRVTAVFPGLTNTPILKGFGFPIPRARLQEAEDVAEAVLGALLLPARATVEEILIVPTRGDL